MPQPPAAAYGRLTLSQHVALLDALPVLAPGDGIPAEVPARMEAYGQLCVPDQGRDLLEQSSYECLCDC